MKFKNFYVWRGKLPHWRADGVTYYTTFRHRRPLTEEERTILLNTLLSLNGKKWDLHAVHVELEKTDIIASLDSVLRESVDLSKVLEPAKRKASNKIQKIVEEKYPLFYPESYDRIIRDEAEYNDFLNEITASDLQEENNFLWIKSQ